MKETATSRHSDTFKVVATTDAALDEKYRRARERWEYHARTLEVAPAPLDVDIEISSFCNLDCVMCERRRMTRTPMNMSLPLFKAIIDQCQAIGVDQVKLNLWGESLVNPRFLDMVRYAKENSDLILQFNTNANLLTPELSQGIVAAGLDKMTISFDGMSAPVYEKIRRKGKFQRVWDNVHALLDAKHQAGSRLPLLTLQILQTPDTLPEIEQFVAYWTGKADFVSVTNISALVDQGILAQSVREQKRSAERIPCAEIWQRLSVFADGTVTVCCSDFQGFLAIGKIGEDRLLDLWRGEKLQKLRQRHRVGDLEGLVCAQCTSTFRYQEDA
ncbi:MAG: radical SAM protein [Thermodesulfobacteriota bacterium]